MGGKGSGRIAQAHLKPCGTVAKYQWHRKNGQNCETCKEAVRLYRRSKYGPRFKKPVQLSRRERNKQTVRNERLSRGCCMDCKMIVDERTIVCMDWDHRDQHTKYAQISDLIGRVPCAVLIQEMAKCDMVCRNCHAIRTHVGKHYLFRRQKKNEPPSLFD